MGTWERIDPVCDRDGCIHRECGVCTILNRTDFGGRECPFYKEPEEEPEPEPDPAKTYIKGLYEKMKEDFWRNKR